ncbi:ABC-three component system protein [Nesterenkonia flava]|uniref:DUF2326 domain-containing protein n=1 Tax=Nesterenkonia flava TaxID=469799 RepID=A0ABU1FXY4_9MICC|nr:ABC-three component system protein [Nesterenkonia flava]MDR5713122.1 DUF2326 domain-containing protein [Nesterenkonia flava]
MFLKSLSSSDARFKSLNFHGGLNILVADRTEGSEQGNSRNSIGKTSFVKVLRYILGGDLAEEFKTPELEEHTFIAALTLPGNQSAAEEVRVSRSVKPTTRVKTSGWSVVPEDEITLDDWRSLLARHVFNIPESAARPTPGQLWGQLIRYHFGKPIKIHASEPDWESGVRLGFLFGLSPETLGRAGDIERLKKQGSAIRKAVEEGALSHIPADESALRAQLAAARHKRERMQKDLRAFKVDEQYAEHQREADQLSATIRKLNDEVLATKRRLRELDEATQAEVDDSANQGLTGKLAKVYAEIGVVLPDLVSRRYEEVAAFHESVLRNRKAFLEQESASLRRRLEEIESERTSQDQRRAHVMQLLNETVALDTFLSLQQDLGEQEALVADLERKLEAAHSVSTIDDNVKLKTAELVASVRTEMSERQSYLDEAISLFNELGAEIYTDREASLLVSPTPKGVLGVKPRISGDASTGVRSVETFMLDIVSVVSAIKAGRAPGLLVHDSHLFDSIDGRQIASCLNIGLFGFQVGAG